MFAVSYFPTSYFPPSYFPKTGANRHGHVAGVGERRRMMIRAMMVSEMQRSVLDRNSRKLVQRVLTAQQEATRLRQKQELDALTEQVMDMTRQAILLAEV